MIRHLRWLPGPGPPAVGWGWTSRLRYRGFPPPLLPSGAHTAHGLTGPVAPCPPNFAGAPALTGDSWVRGKYTSLPSLSPCLGAARVDGSHLYLPFFQRPPFRFPPRLGARCIAGFLPYLPCSFRLLSTSFPTVGRTFRHPLPRGLSKICATDPSFAAKPPVRGPTAVCRGRWRDRVGGGDKHDAKANSRGRRAGLFHAQTPVPRRGQHSPTPPRPPCSPDAHRRLPTLWTHPLSALFLPFLCSACVLRRCPSGRRHPRDIPSPRPCRSRPRRRRTPRPLPSRPPPRGSPRGRLRRRPARARRR